MNNDQKKVLYESIMKNVAKEVKKALGEAETKKINESEEDNRLCFIVSTRPPFMEEKDTPWMLRRRMQPDLSVAVWSGGVPIADKDHVKQAEEQRDEYQSKQGKEFNIKFYLVDGAKVSRKDNPDITLSYIARKNRFYNL